VGELEKRTATAVQDSSLGEDRPKKKARNKKKEGSHKATGATFRTDSSSSSGNNSHGVVGAVSKPRASKPKNAQPLPAVQVHPRGIGPVHVPNLNDVLSGRGERNNPGNVQFRALVAQHKEGYRSKKNQKSRIAAQIVYRIRSLTPPGRFLKEDADGLWFDIGDAEAIRKVQQALSHEDAPYIRSGEKKNTWEQSYQELVGFHAIHGHCEIPSRDKKWKALHKWSYRQKQRRAGSSSHHTSPLTQDQIRKLDAIGFDWTIKKRGKTRDEGGPKGSSGGERSAGKNTEPLHSN